VADPPHRFGYTVGDRYDGTPASTWDFQIDPTGQGCRITQRFQHLSQGISGARLAADDAPADAEAIVQHRQQSLTNGMAQTLQRIKLVLESPPSPDRA
jgi:hypothetical protein